MSAEVGVASIEPKVKNKPGNHATELTEGVRLDASEDLGPNDHTAPSAARITEIDISAPARELSTLRRSDYLLIFVLGGGAGFTLIALLIAPFGIGWDTIAPMPVKVFAAYTGWRYLGVIDQRIWHRYLWLFPLVTVVFLFDLMANLADFINPLLGESRGTSLGYMLLVSFFLFVCISSFVSVLRLRRMSVHPTGVRLKDLLSRFTRPSSIAEHRPTGIPRKGTGRGLAYVISGVVLVIGAQLAFGIAFSLQDVDGSLVTRLLKYMSLPIGVWGCFTLIRARRYFQVDVDSLLTIDKRPPILFLRSFSDDEKQRFWNSQRALLDFSLETRLANHFFQFGPFIAVGSPKEGLPQLGAARVILSDNQWQSQVLSWMKEANVIVMYSGTSEWVNWELRKILESNRSTSLILMFPETKRWTSWSHKREVMARVEHVREMYKGSAWEEELREYRDFRNVRAMLFRPDGSMVMIKSQSRGRDAYHLAALVGHYLLLHPENTPTSTAAGIEDDGPRWTTALAWTLLGILVLGVGFYWPTLDHERKLTFKQGEIYYSETVTRDEAIAVGKYLVKQAVFIDDEAVVIKLSKAEGRYRFGVLIEPASVEKIELSIKLGAMGDEISRKILGGKQVEIAYYDANLNLMKVLPQSAKLIYGKGELYYTAPLDLSEAQALGEWLMQSGFFGEDRAASVHFSREQSGYQLRFVIDPSRAIDSEMTAAFVALSRAIAQQVLGGAAILVHLCDQKFHTLKSEQIEPGSDAQHQ